MTAKQLIKQLQKYIKNNPEGEDDKIVYVKVKEEEK